MRRLLSLLTISTLFAGAAPAHAAGSDVPPNPFVHKGVCPFECCTYRDWTATKPVTLVRKPGSQAIVAQITKGEIVRGLTGEVSVRPARLVATHSYADSPIRAGSVFYALHPAGEGYWSVWHRGKVYSVEFDESEKVHDNSVWWVKIRTRQGLTGWAVSNGQFENQDSCG